MERRSLGAMRSKIGAALVIVGAVVMVGPGLVRDGHLSSEGIGRTALLIGVMVLLNQRTANRMLAQSESKAYEYDKGYEDGWEQRDNELAQPGVIDLSERRTARARAISRVRELVDHV